MTTEARIPAATAIERTRALLYDRGGMREYLESILQQAGVQKGTSLEFESSEDLDCVRISGVLRGGSVRGVSVVKMAQLPGECTASTEYAALVPTQEAFGLLVSNYFSKRQPYFAAGQLYFTAPTQIERDVVATQRYRFYRTVLSDVGKAVDDNIRTIK